MFWADKIKQQIEERYASKIQKGEGLVIRDEKTLSGRVHVGSLRGVAIHGIVSEVLNESKINNKYFFELNDFDPMDGLPVYLDENIFKEHMGKPLCNVPSPDGIAKNYAEYFGDEFVGVIKETGFYPEYYRSSDLYKSGKYNEFIKKALDNADKIREIYKRISGSEKQEKWLPLNVVCEKCGKVGTTRAYDWNGEKVSYECGDFVTWASGCGYKGLISPLDGNAKLPWKVEWAAKFSVLDVSIEGGGKDHSTRGGSRDIADTISREIFDREPPLNIPYEFLNIGGKKMSSSKGRGASSREIADLLPAHILRFLLIGKDYNKVVDFDPEGDTVPILYDTYDTYAKNYFSENKDDFARAFPFFHISEKRGELTQKHLPRFSLISFLAQMPHLDPKKEIESMDGIKLNEEDEKELNIRIDYAKRWLSLYAPDNFKFIIQENTPESVKNFSDDQKKALSELLSFIKSQDSLTGESLHSKLHEIKINLNIDPKLFFSAIYQSILGRDSGPKAGWFISVLDKKFLENRLEEAIK